MGFGSHLENPGSEFRPPASRQAFPRERLEANQMIIILNDRDQPWPSGMHRKNAIVSIVIGDAYQTAWNAGCKNTWVAYADKYEYDIIIVSYYIDNSDRGRSRSPAWQKLLVLDQPWARQYERIVLVDADIVCSKTAPNILDSVPDHRKVGLSVSSDQLSADEKHIYFERLHKTRHGGMDAEILWGFYQENVFKDYGIISGGAPMFNTGVMVLSPQEHNNLLLRTYEKEDRGRLYEQPYLSQALFAEKIFHKISSRFNWGVLELIVLYIPQFYLASMSVADVKTIMPQLLNELDKAYFLHFCGCPTMYFGFSTLIGSMVEAA
ncbi:MAG: hypothetical protein ABSE82_15665 [Nitrososphaerales archaeon]|jgi:hypothetical protein